MPVAAVDPQTNVPRRNMEIDCWHGRRWNHPYETIKNTCRGLPDTANTSRRRHPRAAVLRCGVVLCAIGVWVGVRSYRPRQRDTAVALEGQLQGVAVDDDDDDSLMRVLVTNNYPRSGPLLYPWKHLAEPAKETRIEILSWPGKDGGASLEYTWFVEGECIGTGETINTSFRHPGVYECAVSASLRESAAKEEGDNSLSRQKKGAAAYLERRREEEKVTGVVDNERAGSRLLPSTSSSLPEAGDRAATTKDGSAAVGDSANPEDTLYFVVVVKYVRREIRSMTDRDRETFFNAVSVMQRVPSAVGQAVYGKNYYSKDYFNRLHLYYGGRADCDHWHAGAGFVISHIAVSLMYEQSLQAINPAIALPYWDFTQDGTFYDWSNFRNSSVFSDDWFGTAATTNPMRIATRGRFAYITTMVNATEYSEVHNSYGMLRSPWNNDPTPFMTRSNHLLGFLNHRKPSGCRKYKQAIRKNNWMALTESFNQGAHGEIHELLGGSWSNEASAYANRTSPIVQPFVHLSVPLSKMLWRKGYIQCPDKCSMDVTPWEECTCTCTEDGFSGQNSREVLHDAGVLEAGFFYDEDFNLIEDLVDKEGNAYGILPGYTKEQTETIYDEMLRVLCIPVRTGSHYGATSTNDPTFWLIHPTFDRLWHLRRLEMGRGDGAEFDETWIPDHSCYGHNPGDIQPFHDLFLHDTTARLTQKDTPTEVEVPKHYYTNQQLYTMLKPDKMDNPYVYDNFQWPHCDIQGIYIHGY